MYYIIHVHLNKYIMYVGLYSTGILINSYCYKVPKAREEE